MHSNDPSPAEKIDPEVEDANYALALAKAQRAMMWASAGRIGADTIAMSMVAELVWPVNLVAILILVGFGLAAAWSTARVADLIYGRMAAFACFVLLLAPCYGMLIVLILNGYALDRLRKAGVRGEMMGVPRDELKKLEARAKAPFTT